MRIEAAGHWRVALGLAAVIGLAVSQPGCADPTPAKEHVSGNAAVPVVTATNYYGWRNALALRTPEAEVVVVPEIGRVMSFRLTAGENVFWENPALLGRTNTWNEAAWRQGEWVNFGGDKTWPAPEVEWTRYTK